MPRSRTPIAELQRCIDVVKEHGGIRTKAALSLGIPLPTLNSRLRAAELEGLKVPPPPDKRATPPSHGRIEREIDNGVVIAGSDLHAWPGPPSTALRGYCYIAKRFKKQLRMAVMNGDVMDLSRVSRHPPMGWTRMPETQEEIEAAGEQLGIIEKAVGKVEKIWPAGNHDIRYENYLSSRAPEVANVRGTRLKDHFALWKPCWTLYVNNRPGGLVIQHRFKGGMHAPQANSLWSGRSYATGHLHSQKVQPITDLNGTRWGVDLGMLADPWSPQFEYLEGMPRNWRSGFAVFTFKDGELLPPELVTVVEPGVIFFRGELIEV